MNESNKIDEVDDIYLVIEATSLLGQKFVRDLISQNKKVIITFDNEKKAFNLFNDIWNQIEGKFYLSYDNFHSKRLFDIVTDSANNSIKYVISTLDNCDKNGNFDFYNVEDVYERNLKKINHLRNMKLKRNILSKK